MLNYAPMILYAAAPARRVRQILGDLLFLAWIGVCLWAAMLAREAVLELGAPGEAAVDAADGMSGQLRDVADRIGEVPVVGDGLTAPVAGLADQADGLGAAGAAMVETVGVLSLVVAAAVALIPVLLAAVVYLPVRIRFARRAGAAWSASDDPALFALRALANQPARKLAEISGDPVAAWRNGDEEAIRRLADLELRSAGIRR